MSTTVPLPRSLRQTDIAAAGGQVAFGPTDWTVWDTADVKVFSKAAGESYFTEITSGFTPALAGAAPDVVSVTFDTAPVTTYGAGVTIRIAGARTHERETDVTQGGAVNSVDLERELDKQTTVLQEQRRDIDALQSDFEGALETASDAAVAAAIAAAEAAQGAAETAQGLAETAQGGAEAAQTGAEAAQGLAETAQAGAEAAQGLAETAQGGAEAAETTATAQAGIATTKASEAAAWAASAAANSENPAFSYKWLTDTDADDPGATYVKADNATLPSLTELYISEAALEGDIGAFLTAMTSSTSPVKATLVLLNPAAPLNWLAVDITGTTDHGAWRTFAATYLGHAGTFSLDDELAAYLVRTGNQGAGDLSSANNLSDVGDAATAFGNIKQAASDSYAGAVELATPAEVVTGTDTARAATPEGVKAAIDKQIDYLPVLVFDDSEDVATGDGAGDVFVPIPPALNGKNLVSVFGGHQTAATGSGSQTTDIQIARVRGGTPADMLSTKLTIDEDELDSSSAAAAAVINTSNDDLATGDILRIDVDAIPSGAPKGLLLWLGFQAP